MTDTLRLSPAGATITGIYNNRTTRSQGGVLQVAQFPGGYWKIQISTANMGEIELERIYAFLNKQRGNGTKFNLIIGKKSYTKSGYVGTILVNGASQVGSEINIDGASANTLILRAGDFIKFTSTEKIYQIYDDVITNGSGAATITISPNIITSPNDDDVVIINDVPFGVIFSGPEVAYSLDKQLRGNFSLMFEEAWST